MSKQLYTFSLILLSIVINQSLAQSKSTRTSPAYCYYSENIINNIINGIIKESKTQPNETSRNNFLFTKIEEFRTDLSNCTNIQEYVEKFGASPSFLQRATDTFLWLWGLPLRIVMRTVDDILNAIFAVISKIYNSISNWFFNGISYMANGVMDFKLNWLTKFYDTFSPRMYDFVVAIGPDIAAGFLLLFVPNYTEFSEEITGEILKLVTDLSGSLHSILNPLSLIPGGSWISSWFGGSSNSKPSSGADNSATTEKSNSISSGWGSWLG